MKKVDQLVADERSVATEKCRQEEARPKPVQKMELGEEDQRENTGRRERQLAGHEHVRALGHRELHDGIGFDHAPLEQLQRQERVRDREQHRADREEEQPGVVPVDERDVVVGGAAMLSPSRQHEPVDHGPPGEIAPVAARALLADRLDNRHIRCYSELSDVTFSR